MNFLDLYPNAKVTIDQLKDAMAKYGVETDDQKNAFLAQCAHESVGFSVLHENLNYSAQALLAVFPKYFTATSAQNYARNPQAIANRVYANRMGNGSESSGDGWAYRGRGLIQITGYNNYLAFFQSVSPDNFSDLVQTPDLVEKDYPCHSAAWFWKTNNLNDYVDDFLALTKRINGGTNGYQDRLAQLNKIQEAQLWT